MKHLVAVLVVFFLMPALLLAQGNIVVLPPLAASRTATPPPEELRKILVSFRNHYREELRDLLASEWTPGMWWITVLLMPDEKYKGWCIVIGGTKGEKNPKAITITRIPIPADKAAFDSAAEAKKAAEKTKEKITGRSSIAWHRTPLNKASSLFFRINIVILWKTLFNFFHPPKGYNMKRSLIIVTILCLSV